MGLTWIDIVSRSPALDSAEYKSWPGVLEPLWSTCFCFPQEKRPIRQLTKSTPPTIRPEISAMNKTDQLMDVDGNCSTSNWKKSNGDFPLAMIYLVKPQH